MLNIEENLAICPGKKVCFCDMDNVCLYPYEAKCPYKESKIGQFWPCEDIWIVLTRKGFVCFVENKMKKKKKPKSLLFINEVTFRLYRCKYSIN